MCVIITKLNRVGGVAQLGERTVRIRKVKGSNPSVSTKKPVSASADTGFLSCAGGIRIMSAHAGGFCCL